MTEPVSVTAIEDVSMDAGFDEFQETNERSDYGSILITRKGEVTHNAITVNTTYNARTNDRYIFCEGALDIDIILPESSTGKVYEIYNLTDGQVLVRADGAKINGSDQFSLQTTYKKGKFVFNGTEWNVNEDLPETLQTVTGRGNTTNTIINADGFAGDTLRISESNPPSGAISLGTIGDFTWDSNYLYICFATNEWRRVAHSTW